MISTKLTGPKRNHSDQMADQEDINQPASKTADKRQYKRVELVMSATLLDKEGNEYGAEIGDISVGGLYVQSSFQPETGADLVAYIDGLGRMDIKVVRMLPDGFGATIVASDRKRLRLMDKITLYVNGEAPDPAAMVEDMYNSLGSPTKETSPVQRDGHPIKCTVSEITRDGIVIESHHPFLVGDQVTVGPSLGEVVALSGRQVAIKVMRQPVQ